MTLALTRVRPLTVPVAFAVAGIAAQLAYPLVGGRVRDTLTVTIVLALAAAAVTHAAVTRGGRAGIGLLAATALPGFGVEVLGVRTGAPFGDYVYTDALGPRLLGVPPVIALAWTMLAWPAAVAAVRLVRSTAARVAAIAATLTGLDLFLDPQMVRAGYWHWQHPTPHLPGVPDVPLTNLAGWVLVTVVIAVLVVRLAGEPGDDRLPLGLFVWLYVGWIVALGGFGGQPAAAAWGAVALAPVAVPTARSLLPR